jgi:hypothetical protein
MGRANANSSRPGIAGLGRPGLLLCFPDHTGQWPVSSGSSLHCGLWTLVTAPISGSHTSVTAVTAGGSYFMWTSPIGGTP